MAITDKIFVSTNQGESPLTQLGILLNRYDRINTLFSAELSDNLHGQSVTLVQQRFNTLAQKPIQQLRELFDKYNKEQLLSFEAFQQIDPLLIHNNDILEFIFNEQWDKTNADEIRNAFAQKFFFTTENGEMNATLEQIPKKSTNIGNIPNNASTVEQSKQKDKQKGEPSRSDHSIKSQANEGSYYNEQQILKVWDVYATTKKLKYWFSNTEERASIFADANSMNIVKRSGLLLNEDGTLFVNESGKSVSISGPVDYMSNANYLDGYDGITNDINVALDQIREWNLEHPQDNIASHTIIFPYHITVAHWGLGILSLNPDEQQAAGMQTIELYNPLPECGGTKISDQVTNEVLTSLRERLDAPNITLDNPEKSFKQQNDGTSCGVISAENGKDFIDGGSAKRINAVYASGAQVLREKHLAEVSSDRFTAMQSRNEEWSDSKFVPPGNIRDIARALHTAKAAFPEDLSLLPLAGGTVEKAQVIRNIIASHPENFNNIEIEAGNTINLYDLLFYAEGNELKFRDGTVDILKLTISNASNADPKLSHPVFNTLPNSSSVPEFFNPEADEETRKELVEGLRQEIIRLRNKAIKSKERATISNAINRVVDPQRKRELEEEFKKAREHEDSYGDNPEGLKRLSSTKLVNTLTATLEGVGLYTPHSGRWYLGELVDSMDFQQFINKNETNYIYEKRQNINTEAYWVDQREVAFLHAQDIENGIKLGTDNVQQCVVVMISGNDKEGNKLAALAHIDRFTKPESLREVLQLFENDEGMSIVLYGGRDRSSSQVDISDYTISGQFGKRYKKPVLKIKYKS